MCVCVFVCVCVCVCAVRVCVSMFTQNLRTIIYHFYTEFNGFPSPRLDTIPKFKKSQACPAIYHS